MSDVDRLALLCGTRAEGINAILDYTRLLDDELRDQGISSVVEVVESKMPDLHSYDLVVLQYNPFLYGRWGFAPHLLASLTRARLGRTRPRLALMVHETYCLPSSNWRGVIMGSAQWGQLRALHTLSDLVFSSIDPWGQLLARWRPRRPVVHLPVGSNLPDRRGDRAMARQEIEADDATVVVASFGTGDPSRLAGHLTAAVNAVAGHHDRVVMLNLGAGARILPGLDREVRVVRPGKQSSADVARLLSASDLFLAPFVDGVSTRRGSLMAALQHALPVVGTHGELTDAVLYNSGALELVPVDDLKGFARAAWTIAANRDRRTDLGVAAAALYRREFDWPVIAARMCERLSPNPDHPPSASTSRSRLERSSES